MSNIVRQTAYSTDELTVFLKALADWFVDGYGTDTKAGQARAEIALDALAAVRAAVQEYGLNSSYVGAAVFTPYARVVIERNRQRLGHRVPGARNWGVTEGEKARA